MFQINARNTASITLRNRMKMCTFFLKILILQVFCCCFSWYFLQIVFFFKFYLREDDNSFFSVLNDGSHIFNGNGNENRNEKNCENVFFSQEKPEPL